MRGAEIPCLGMPVGWGDDDASRRDRAGSSRGTYADI
jgi:hypothetical protein